MYVRVWGPVFQRRTHTYRRLKSPHPSPSIQPTHSPIHHPTINNRGFRFSVLPPGAFLVHFPHAPSQSKKSWLGGHHHNGNNGNARPVSHRERMDALYDHFLSWAMQERAARAGDMVRLCPPPLPSPPPLAPGEEADKAGVTSVA